MSLVGIGEAVAWDTRRSVVIAVVGFMSYVCSLFVGGVLRVFFQGSEMGF